jgi:peptidoglycan hydrolase-like protein with peptidoglycan-binding domain
VREDVPDAEGDHAGDDIAGRSRWLIALLGLMLRRPQDTIAGAVAVIALVTILINALFLQPDPHPAPIFSVKPKASPAAAHESTGTVVLPRPRPADLAGPRAELATPPLPGRARSEIVAGIQRELARRGFYDGAIDGIPGSRSAAAIRGFEQAAGLAPSGEPSEALLQAIMRAPNVTKPVPGPGVPRHDPIGELVARTDPQAAGSRPDPGVAVPHAEPDARALRPEPAAAPALRSEPVAAPALRSEPVAAPALRPESAAAPARIEPVAMRARPEPVVVPPTRAEPGPVAARTELSVTASRDEPRPSAPIPSSQVKAVQKVLSEYGYGQVKPTGILDADTRLAIEQFEGMRDLPVTGQVNDDVVRELAVMTGRPIE